MGKLYQLPWTLLLYPDCSFFSGIRKRFHSKSDRNLFVKLLILLPLLWFFCLFPSPKAFPCNWGIPSFPRKSDKFSHDFYSSSTRTCRNKNPIRSWSHVSIKREREKRQSIDFYVFSRVSIVELIKSRIHVHPESLVLFVPNWARFWVRR